MVESLCSPKEVILRGADLPNSTNCVQAKNTSNYEISREKRRGSPTIWL